MLEKSKQPLLDPSSHRTTSIAGEAENRSDKDCRMPGVSLEHYDSTAEFDVWLSLIHDLEGQLGAQTVDSCDAWKVSLGINKELSQLRAELEDRFLSYDCHTFVYSALERVGHLIPYVKDGMNGVFKHAFDVPATTRAILDSSEGQEITRVQRELTAEFYQQGMKINLPVTIKNYNRWRDALTKQQVGEHRLSQMLKEAEAPALWKARETLQLMQLHRTSHWILLSRGEPGKDFVDLHSMITLGLNLQGTDLWIAHKRGIGCEIEFHQLSLILADYITGTSSPGDSSELQLNILAGSVGSILTP